MARFGVQIEPQLGFSYPEIRTLARESERLGYHSLFCSDHLFLDPRRPEVDCLECWTTLSALIGETRTLRLGSMVSCNSYRQPSLLAKVAATFDVLSGGRLEFGIGAGWKEVEYKAYGIPFPKASTRIEQLAEAVQIIRAMWTQNEATFGGKHYTIEEAVCEPKPLQNPHPKIMIGGEKPRLLRVVAEHADAWNLAWTQTPEEFEEKVGILEEHCSDVGRDIGEIEKTLGAIVVVGEDEEQIRGKVKKMLQQWGSELTVDEYLTRVKGALVGTPEQVRGILREYIDLDIDHFILMFPDIREITPLRYFASQVMSKL
ncbi:MAG: TIGR03560 family F420-dependent LLM class oxidoreductase [Candidatus Geothermarchaeales archaeon]